MANLRSVASAAGVHVATASAVLNPSTGNTRVSESTRKRVLSAARKLAYIPNESARRLRTGRSDIVGFLGGDLRNPFFAEFTAALEGQLAELNFQLVVSHIARADAAVIEKTIRSLQQQKVKRIICWEEGASPWHPKNKAIVSTGFTTQERPGVWLDLEFAIENAVQELKNRGFTKLGFFSPGSQQESPSVGARSKAFVQVCKRQALAKPTLVSFQGESFDLPASIKGASQILKFHSQVEAWLGFNDISSLGLLHVLPKKWNERVICFDGTIPVRCWPGYPSYLDLKIPDLARTVAGVVAGRQNINALGQRKNWLRPSLAQ